MRSNFKTAVIICALALAACSAESQQVQTVSDTAAAEENPVVNNSSAYALANNLDGETENEPFSSYSYDFSAWENNYIVTAEPDETGVGLTLTIEDNQFGFTKYDVTPPAGYMVCLPCSQRYAGQVCTVIKGSSGSAPDILKIDFCLLEAGDGDLPYTVSRLYSIKDGKFVEIEVYNTQEKLEDGTFADVLEKMDYIPESDLYHTEETVFMPEPAVTEGEDGTLSAEIVTYTLNPDDMTMRREYQDCSDPDGNTLYYGYAAYAVAGEVYKYFVNANLPVSDYENYVEVPGTDGGSRYYFKVDDPRFSTVEELREYALRYFDEKLVNQMFLRAPQQYRDIDGELYTILGDGGGNEELGKVTITSCWNGSDNIYNFSTKQEKFDSEGTFEGYVDGGDLAVEVQEDGSFIVTQYRYPTE